MTFSGLIHHPPAEWLKLLEQARDRGLRGGRVLACTRTFCTLLEAGGQVHQTRIPGRLHHLARRGEGLVPVVGDAVLFRPERPGREGVVETVLPRRTCIVRQAPGRSGRQVPQVICANVDTVLVVTGLDLDFNVRRIERYLALVAGSGAEAVLVLNKVDLCDHLDQRLEQVGKLGCESVLPICAKTGRGTDRLAPWLTPGTTLAMLGSSGAGKSTLANLLLGQDRQQVGDLSDTDGRGQHTTTHREMFRLPGGAFLIDNPGMREIQLLDEATDLEEAFADIIELGCRCRFGDCRHDREPDCAVRAAVDRGELDPDRYRNYLQLAREREERQRDY
ncbi:MAG: ribosome small subunit-dependent GTPase A [Deltaproteobacteria bacterium]|nr:MAG: ribosome small subunit-dependent GTPase A [Deltaproteobacteria bacterium]